MGMKQKTKAIFLIALSIMMLLYAVYRTIGTINFVVTGFETEGIVRGHECKQVSRTGGSGRMQIRCALKVTFVDDENSQREFSTDIFVKKERYPIGIKVDVIYDKDDKSVAKINSFSALWTGDLVMFAIVLTFLGLACFGYRVYADIDE